MSGSAGTPVPGTAVPIPSFTANGFIVPAQGAIVTGLQSDWNAAFGGNLNPAPNTPQGQIIASQAALLGAMNDQLVALFNGVDPAIATGLMQDAIGFIYFIQRLPALATALNITCGGLAGATIPVNVYVQDTSGNIYFNTQQATIGPGGTVNSTFQAVNTGPIPIPASVTIYSAAVPHWDTAVVAAGVVGNNIEGQTQFELRRALSVAGNAQSTVSTIYSNVAAVVGVARLFVIDWPFPSPSDPLITGGVTLPANSIFVCTAGDSTDDVYNQIALAIYEKKPVGIPYFPGSKTVNVQDPNPVYTLPNGSYIGPVSPVTWEVAVAAPICFNVVIYSPSTNTTVPANAGTLIQAAIQNGFNGTDVQGSTPATIGSLLFANQPYIANINMLGSWAQVVSITIGLGILGTLNANAPNMNQFTGSISGITLTIAGGVLPPPAAPIATGMFLYGAGILPGTIITAGSGSSWTISVSQTVSSTTITSVLANLTAVQTQWNWIPTLASPDINVTVTSVP